MHGDEEGPAPSTHTGVPGRGIRKTDSTCSLDVPSFMGYSVRFGRRHRSGRVFGALSSFAPTDAVMRNLKREHVEDLPRKVSSAMEVEGESAQSCAV